MHKGTCSVEGCTRPAKGRGWCSTHYARWREGRDFSVPGRLPGLPRQPIEERLERHISRQPDGCWLWTGYVQSNGYARLRLRQANRWAMAHRLAYETWVGPIPEGLTIDHLCRVRHCVNPAHLEPVTQRENNRRGQSPIALQARQTHCIRGHPFDEENTYIRRDTGDRQCRECARERHRRTGQ